MSQFYGSMQGDRKEVTRRGNKNSGFVGHIRGWDVGARVEMHHNETTGQDEVKIYLIGGSGGRSSDRLMGTYTAENLK